MLLPVLAFDAHALACAGRAGESEASANELLTVWLDDGRGLSLASFWLPDLAFGLVELGRAGELGGLARRVRTRTRWLDAAEAIGEGNWARAADIFAAIGSLPDEALARVRTAGALESAGRPVEADEQRRRANAFFETVGAAAQAHAPAK